MKPLDEQRDKSSDKQPQTKKDKDKLIKKYTQHLTFISQNNFKKGWKSPQNNFKKMLINHLKNSQILNNLKNGMEFQENNNIWNFSKIFRPQKEKSSQNSTTSRFAVFPIVGDFSIFSQKTTKNTGNCPFFALFCSFFSFFSEKSKIIHKFARGICRFFSARLPQNPSTFRFSKYFRLILRVKGGFLARKGGTFKEGGFSTRHFVPRLRNPPPPQIVSLLRPPFAPPFGRRLRSVSVGRQAGGSAPRGAFGPYPPSERSSLLLLRSSTTAILASVSSTPKESGAGRGSPPRSGGYASSPLLFRSQAPSTRRFAPRYFSLRYGLPGLRFARSTALRAGRASLCFLLLGASPLGTTL